MTPPLLCIEIMSPTDRLSRAKIVLEDYRRMGVPNIWLINPFGRKAYVYDSEDLHEVPLDQLKVPGSHIYIEHPNLLEKIFGKAG